MTTAEDGLVLVLGGTAALHHLSNRQGVRPLPTPERRAGRGTKFRAWSADCRKACFVLLEPGSPRMALSANCLAHGEPIIQCAISLVQGPGMHLRRVTQNGAASDYLEIIMSCAVAAGQATTDYRGPRLWLSGTTTPPTRGTHIADGSGGEARKLNQHRRHGLQATGANAA
jgi:hypothetical protein